MHAKSLQSIPTLCNAMDHQAPPSKGFSRQEYWSGSYTPLEGIFLTEGSNPHFLWFLHWQAGSSPLVPPEKEYYSTQTSNIKSSVFLLNSIELFYFHSSKINIFQVLSEKFSSHPTFHLTSIKHPHRQSLFRLSVCVSKVLK